MYNSIIIFAGGFQSTNATFRISGNAYVTAMQYEPMVRDIDQDPVGKFFTSCFSVSKGVFDLTVNPILAETLKHMRVDGHIRLIVNN